MLAVPEARFGASGNPRTSISFLPVAQILRQPVATPRRRAQMLIAMKTTEGGQVKASRAFVTDQSARHRQKDSIEGCADVDQEPKSGLPRFVPSQVPKCEAPGAPTVVENLTFQPPAPGPPGGYLLNHY